jgi:hypothetical protein
MLPFLVLELCNGSNEIVFLRQCGEGNLKDESVVDDVGLDAMSFVG